MKYLKNLFDLHYYIAYTYYQPLKHYSQLSASATVASLLSEDSEFVSADLTALFGKMKIPYFRVR